MDNNKYLGFKEFVKTYVDKRKTDLKAEIKDMAKDGGCSSLLIVQVGDNFASSKYVAGKMKDCDEVGIDCCLKQFPENVTEDELLSYLDSVSKVFGGIIVQLPLPKHISVDKVIKALPANCDVDGFKAESPFEPCTPLGVYNLLMEIFKDDKMLEGKNIVILGRSDIVGKPMAKILIEKTNSTVTVCNSHTKNLSGFTRSADILISAIGKANFVTASMVKDGSVVIDVGINRGEDGKMCGDVEHSDELIEKVEFLTPVPGGVGLLTRLSLIENTVAARKYRISK